VPGGGDTSESRALDSPQSADRVCKSLVVKWVGMGILWGWVVLGGLGGWAVAMGQLTALDS